MKKTYILDTNVLIQAPYAVECFEENEVILPMTVLEELDNLKKKREKKGKMSVKLSVFWKDTEEKEICWKEYLQNMEVCCV